MEQLQTTRFINGLRRAVDDNLRSRGIQPNTHNLPNYAYNNTTKELARLHQQPECEVTQSATHIKDNLEHHMLQFQKRRIQILQDSEDFMSHLAPNGSDTEQEEPT